jgi:hypothetical protein
LAAQYGDIFVSKTSGKKPKGHRRKNRLKSKTLPLLVLLTLLLIPKGFTQTPPESPESFGNAYGIKPEQFYPGTAVLELMETAEAEIDEAVNEAYAEGYKAAMLRYAPEAELYKTLAADMRTELEAERKKSRALWPAIGISAGISFAAGVFCSFLAAGR